MGSVGDERLMQKSSHVRSTSGTLSPIREWTGSQLQETLTAQKRGAQMVDASGSFCSYSRFWFKQRKTKEKPKEYGNK